MFENRIAVCAAVALNGITFCSDRGYWKPSLILMLLALGAIVFGTLQRMEWVPFTYDQPMKKHDKRERIEKKFGRSIFIAFARCGLDMLKTLAWRSGTGTSVSLAMTSDCDEDESQIFDFCFANNGDAVWYKNEDLSQDKRNLKAFHGSMLGAEEGEQINSIKNDIDFHLKILASNNVTMLCVGDHSFDWFVLRMFAFTSSSTEATLRYTAPFIPLDCEAHSSFERVLSFAGLDQHLSRNSTAESNGDRDSNDESGSASNEPPIDGNLISTIVKSMRSPTQTIVNRCGRDILRIKNALDNNMLSSASIEAIMVALGFSRNRAGADLEESAKTKLLTKWIRSITSCVSGEGESDTDSLMSESDGSLPATAVPYKFPYDILNANEVKALLHSRVGSNAVTACQVPGPYSNPTKVGQRRETL